MRRRILGTLACGVLLVTAACGDEGQDPAASPSSPAAAAPATLEVAQSALGSILMDSEGRTVYMFEPDKGGPSVCYGECAKAWPAVIADEPVAGEGLQQPLLGTVARKDGSLQVTYNSLPLYIFAFDEKPGDTTGQGSNDVWWVVSPEGKPVRT